MGHEPAWFTRGARQIGAAHNVQRVALQDPESFVAPLLNQTIINYLQEIPILVPGMHLSQLPAFFEAEREHPLTSIFQTVESHEVPVVEAAAAKKNGWLPLLVVLFLISYGLMTMLIIEQGRTIESQRALIRDLFHDSTELSAVKMKAAEQRAQTQSQVTRNPSSQISTQNPSAQAPNRNAPSSQAQAHTQNQTAKRPFQMPSRPAADINNRGRMLMSI